jgi:hypothetical protein
MAEPSVTCPRLGVGAPQRAQRETSMDAAYFREKAETCLRLAKGLSWNNPARDKLMELAEEFERQARDLEAPARTNKRS